MQTAATDTANTWRSEDPPTPIDNVEPGRAMETPPAEIGTESCERHSVRSGALSNRSNASRRSRASSLLKKRQLELRAAEERAKIARKAIRERLQSDIELVNRRLAVELAEIEMNESIEQAGSEESFNTIDSWVDYNNTTHPASENENLRFGNTSSICQPNLGNETYPTAALEHATQTLNRTVDALRRQVETHNSSDFLVKRLTSAKQLPKFDGNGLEWLRFKRSFELSTQLGCFTEVENVSRLFNCLEGDAKKAVESLMMTTSSAEQIMDTLELRFGNPEVITRKIVNELKGLPKISSGQTDLVTLATMVKNGVAAMEAVKSIGYLHNPELVNNIIAKMPSAMIYNYNRYLHENPSDQPRLKIVAEFLYQEAEMASKAGTGVLFNQIKKREVNQRVDNYPTRGKKRKYYALLNTTDSGSSIKKLRGAEKQSSSECGYCRKKAHQVTECRKFAKIQVKERWQWAKKRGICYRCLRGPHRYTQCKEIGCARHPDCRERHHELLHQKRERQDRSRIAKPNQSAADTTEERLNS